MKNYIKNISVITLILAVFVLTGCDIDDVKPIGQLEADKTVKDETSAKNVLRGVYHSYREFGVGFFPIHLGAYGNEGRISGFLLGMKGFNENNVPVENQFLGDLYNNYYKIINNANFLIGELEAGKAVGISDVNKNEIMGQAKALRGLAYFNLLKYFGHFFDTTSEYGLVIRTEFSTEIDVDARSSVQDVYNLILDDLNFAVENAPEFVEHFYIGKTTARGLLAKVNLYLGNNETAAELAMEVINNFEGYTLEPNYADIFMNSYTSSEVLFAPAAPSRSESSRMDNVRQTTYSEILRSQADFQVGDSLDGDLVSGTGYDPRFTFAYSDFTLFNKNSKYPFLDSSTKQNTTFWLRLPEVYLIHAEAEARKVDGDLDLALGSLNVIRNRVGLTPKELSDKATLLEDIRNEKLLELFLENGEGWFDMVRYHILGDVDAFTIKPTLTSINQFAMPIPLGAIVGNNKLKQNPGYE